MLLTHITLQSDINNYNIRFLILECLFFVKLSYMKHILITGASKGIGLELAKLFSIQNHKVIALSRNTSHLKSLTLDNVTCLDLDITKEEQNNILNNAIKNVFNNRVDILINNAGLLANSSFNTTSLDTFKSVYNTNVYGVVNMTQQALPYMNNKSHVVNISSMGGIQGSMKFAGLSAYSSSKGALITLTELLAEEYKETGPSFNVLALGARMTKIKDMKQIINIWLETDFEGGRHLKRIKKNRTLIFIWGFFINNWFDCFNLINFPLYIKTNKSKILF